MFFIALVNVSYFLSCATQEVLDSARPVLPVCFQGSEHDTSKYGALVS